MEDVKIATSDIEGKQIKGFYPVKIVKLESINKPCKAQAYVLKKNNNGVNYIAELPIVVHEYEFMGTICYLWDELSLKEKELYQDKVETVLMKDKEVKFFESKPKNKIKNKKRTLK